MDKINKSKTVDLDKFGQVWTRSKKILKRIFGGSLKLAKIADVSIELLSITIVFIILMAINFLLIKNAPREFAILLFEYVLVFGCIIVHEFGHIFMARKYKISAKKIVILPIGCVAILEQIPKDYRQEFHISIIGPVTTICLAIFFLPFDLYWSFNFIPGVDVFKFLLVANIVIAIFNLIPIFPLDGGRITRALLQQRFKNRLGATWITRKLSFLYLPFLFFIAFKLYAIWLVIVLVFLFFMGKREYEQLRNYYISLYEAESNLKLSKESRKKLIKDIDRKISKKYKLRDALWPPWGMRDAPALRKKTT